MTDITKDPTLLTVETTVDTDKGAEGFSSFLEKMSSQSNETAKLLKELGGQLESLVDTVISKSQQARDTANKASDSVAVQQKTIQEKLGELKAETALSLEHIEKLYSEYGIKATGSIEMAAASYEKAIRQIKEEAANPHGKLKGDEAKALLNEFEADLRAIRTRIEDQKKKGITDILREKTPEMSVTGDLGSSVGAVTNSITSAIPSMVLKGGLIGMLLYGIGEAEVSRQNAASTILWFRKEVGDTSRDIAGDVGGSVAQVAASLDALSGRLKVSNTELGAAYSAMAKLGLSAKDAGMTLDQMDKALAGTSLTASGLQSNLGVLSIAVDKAFGLATGKSLDDAAKASREMGISIQAALEQMTHLRIAAEASGIGIDRYLGSVMTASKGLGQFGIDLGAATQLMQVFTDTDKEMGGNGARAGKAMQGVGQLFGNLQSNVGMTAFLGEKVFGGDPIEARRQMMMQFGDGNAGASSQGRQTLASVIEEVQKVGKSAGGGAAQQEFAIEKVFGVDFQTAELIRSLKPEQIKSLKEGGTGGMSQGDFEKVAKGFESSKERENSFKDFIKSMITAIKDLLVGMLQGIVAIAAYMQAGITGDKRAADEMMGAAFTRVRSSMIELGKSGANMAGNVAEGLGVTGAAPSRLHMSADEMAKQQAASQKGYEDYGKRHGAPTPVGREPIQPGQPGFQSGGQDHGHGYMEHDPATGDLVATVKVKMTPQTLNNQRRAQAMSRGNRG